LFFPACIKKYLFIISRNLKHCIHIWYSIPSYIAWVFLRELKLVVTIVFSRIVLPHICKERLVFYRVIQDGIESDHSSSSFLIKKLSILSLFLYLSGCSIRYSIVFSILIIAFLRFISLRCVTKLYCELFSNI